MARSLFPFLTLSEACTMTGAARMTSGPSNVRSLFIWMLGLTNTLISQSSHGYLTGCQAAPRASRGMKRSRTLPSMQCIRSARVHNAQVILIADNQHFSGWMCSNSKLTSPEVSFRDEILKLPGLPPRSSVKSLNSSPSRSCTLFLIDLSSQCH